MYISNLKNIVIKILLVTISLIVALIIAEFTVRIFLSDKIIKKTQFIPSEYKELVYEYAPAKEFFSPVHKTTISINTSGYRDKEFSIDKPADTTRIICLGDSATFGSKIKDLSQTYPKQLETLLNINGKQYEVFNMGVEGYNTHHEVAALQYKGLQYNPDIAILTLNFGDDGHDWVGVRYNKVVNNIPKAPVLGKVIPDSLHNYLINHSLIYYYLELILYKNFLSEQDKKEYYIYVDQQQLIKGNLSSETTFNKEQLLKFKQICHQNNIIPIVAIMPWFNVVTNEQSPEIPKKKQLIKFLKEHNIIYVDLFKPVMCRSPKEIEECLDYTRGFMVEEQDPHPNEKALKLYAKEIQKVIKDINRNTR
jgi:hypothetical protein